MINELLHRLSHVKFGDARKIVKLVNHISYSYFLYVCQLYCTHYCCKQMCRSKSSFMDYFLQNIRTEVMLKVMKVKACESYDFDLICIPVFLEWQPCPSPVMVFCLSRGIYLGFSQCQL